MRRVEGSDPWTRAQQWIASWRPYVDSSREQFSRFRSSIRSAAESPEAQSAYRTASRVTKDAGDFVWQILFEGTEEVPKETQYSDIPGGLYHDEWKLIVDKVRNQRCEEDEKTALEFQEKLRDQAILNFEFKELYGSMPPQFQGCFEYCIEILRTHDRGTYAQAIGEQDCLIRNDPRNRLVMEGLSLYIEAMKLDSFEVVSGNVASDPATQEQASVLGSIWSAAVDLWEGFRL